RDNVKVKEALEEIRKAAKDESVNIMPKILEAVKVYATLGEICDVLREEFGEYRESIIL
ncbi:MAG: methylmalonyl-CoA mutase, partial [Acetomicrobium sp.]|nr:methylmalonyl-CoA mutase [Acetomicrobium sp.]